MLAPPIPANGITFSWYVKDETTLSIANFVVHSKRRDGTGTRVFRDWEASIPPQFTKIELRAKNEDAHKFWLAMGFENDFEPNEDGSCCMSKKVNQPVSEPRPRAGLSM